MFLSLARPRRGQIVDRGAVSCPFANRDVEFDRCLTCRWLTDVSSEDSIVRVRCRPPARMQDARRQGLGSLHTV